MADRQRRESMVARFSVLQNTRTSVNMRSSARRHSTLAIVLQDGSGPSLCAAARAGNIVKVRQLLERDDGSLAASVADEQEPLIDKESKLTPLMLACIADGHTPFEIDRSQEARVEVVKALLAARAPVNIMGPGGWTALIFAAYYAQENILKLLLEAKADVQHEDEAHRGAGSWARYGDTDQVHLKPVIKMLTKYGMKQSIEQRVKASEVNECVFHSPITLNRNARRIMFEAAEQHGGRPSVIGQMVGKA